MVSDEAQLAHAVMCEDKEIEQAPDLVSGVDNFKNPTVVCDSVFATIQSLFYGKVQKNAELLDADRQH